MKKKTKMTSPGLLVNAEQFLAMRNLLAQVTAEMAVLKKAINADQEAVLDQGRTLVSVGRELISVRQELQLLKSYVDRTIGGQKK